MGALDKALPSVARTLIGVLGATATLVRTTPGMYVPETDTTPAPTVTPYSVKITPPTYFATNEIDGTNVQIGDMRCSVAAQGLAIVPDIATDHLEFKSGVFRLIQVSPVYSGDAAATYELHLRA